MLITVIPVNIWMHSNIIKQCNYENEAHKYFRCLFFAVFVYYKPYFILSKNQKYGLIYHFYRVKLLNLVAIKWHKHWQFMMNGRLDLGSVRAQSPGRAPPPIRV